LLKISTFLRWHYLHLILYTINTLCNRLLIQENPLITVDQFRIVQIAIDVATTIGILPQLKVLLTKKHSRTFNTKQDNNNILEVNNVISIL
jgi:hypothetical protein